MITLKRTNSGDHDFISLVKFLDAELAQRDGEDHPFYAQFNTIDKIKHVVIAFEDEQPVGCGAIKEYGTNTMEIKRMYVSPESRKKGIATKILSALEDWGSNYPTQDVYWRQGRHSQRLLNFTKRTDIC
jgi:putative acetyltransferase